MTAEDFNAWLAEMRAANIARNAKAAAKLLGVHPNSVASMKKNGTDRRTALACFALLHRFGLDDDEALT